MESHCYAQVFSSLQDSHFWWNFSCVRVEYVWEDIQEKMLYIILLDQNREKMVALVNRNLLHLYKERNLVGGVFSLEHFQVGGTNYEYPRYEKYSFLRGEMQIYISKNTKLIPLTSDIERQFPLYPSVTSIKTLAQDRTPRKMMIEEDMFPFKLKRKQFPIRLCFAMTINKAQGLTIPVVGVYLPESVFSHGQLYVALSRGISRGNTKVLVNPAKRFDQDGIYTSNVVYQEVLTDDFV